MRVSAKTKTIPAIERLCAVVMLPYAEPQKIVSVLYRPVKIKAHKLPPHAGAFVWPVHIEPVKLEGLLAIDTGERSGPSQESQECNRSAFFFGKEGKIFRTAQCS